MVEICGALAGFTITGSTAADTMLAASACSLGMSSTQTHRQWPWKRLQASLSTGALQQMGPPSSCWGC